MKEFLQNYSANLFAFESTTSAKFIILSDINSTIQNVYEDDNLIIRDLKDLSKKDWYRQLILKKSPNEVEAEMRLYNISEKDAKSSSVLCVKTNRHFKNKKEKSCTDQYLIINHYIKMACSSMHFLDLSDWDKKPKEVLIVGGNVGTLPYFFKSIFKDFINLTILEKNQTMKDLGEEYFGYTNLNKWEFVVNYLSYIQSIYDKRNTSKAKAIDLIVINENNYFEKESISPHPDLISKKSLEMYKVSKSFKHII